MAETLEIERSSTGKLLDSLELRLDKKELLIRRIEGQKEFLTKEVEPIIKDEGYYKKVREVSLGKLSSQQDDCDIWRN